MIRDGLVTEHAKQIWWSGVEAARADRLTRRYINASGNTLRIGDSIFSGDAISRLVLIGAGKASEAMAYGFLSQTKAWLEQNQITVCGQLHIPVADQDNLTSDEPVLRNLPDSQFFSHVNLLALRPRGENRTSQPIVEATQRLLKFVKHLGPRDFVVSLISGGGSALLCSPAEGITVGDQITVTNALSENGATIQQLNTIRRCIDQVKCGGLANANAAGHQISLVLSDVIGDDPSTIASGPTWVTDRPYRKAIKILQAFDPEQVVSKKVTHYLETKARLSTPEPTRIQNPHMIVGNLGSGVEAAAQQARSLGYRVIAEIAEQPELLSSQAEHLVATLTGCVQPTCVVSGGEPTLQLAPIAQRGIGGRNQQIAIEALQKWSLRYPINSNCPEFCFLSAGTDGEDGLSQAAGGFCNRQTLHSIREQKLNLENHIRCNNAERLLRVTDSLFWTGNTHTNICDIRVFIAQPK